MPGTWVVSIVAAFLILTLQGDAQGLGLKARGTRIGPPCTINVTEARFTSTTARYTFAGTCTIVPTEGPAYPVAWTGQGAIDHAQGRRTEEKIVILPPAPGEPAPAGRVQGTITARWFCSNDRWLEDAGQCGEVTMTTTGAIDRREVDDLYSGNPSFKRPMTSWLSAEARAALVAQRQYDLDPARRREGPLQGRAPIASAAMAVNAPRILMPDGTPARSVYRAQNAITIRLAPPPNTTVQSYSLEIDKRKPDGTWERSANLPLVPASEAERAGYRGFGGARPGTPANMIASEGTWRVRARAASPNQSARSAWQPFTVVRADDPRRLGTDGVVQDVPRRPGGGDATRPQR